MMHEAHEFSPIQKSGSITAQDPLHDLQPGQGSLAQDGRGPAAAYSVEKEATWVEAQIAAGRQFQGQWAHGILKNEVTIRAQAEIKPAWF